MIPGSRDHDHGCPLLRWRKKEAEWPTGEAHGVVWRLYSQVCRNLGWFFSRYIFSTGKPSSNWNKHCKSAVLQCLHHWGYHLRLHFLVRQRFDPPDPGRIIPIDQLAVCFSVQAMPLWVGIRPKWRLGLGRNMGLQNAHETWSVFSLSMVFCSWEKHWTN